MPNFLHQASGVNGSGAFWSFNLKSSGSITESAAETAWAGAVAAFFGDATVKTYYSTGTELTATSTSTASALWKQTTITRTAHSVAGTAATQELPDFCAMVLTLRSAFADKSGHGRWFLPAPVAAVLSVGTGGHLDATKAGNIATAIVTLFGSLTTAGLTPLLLTRKATLGGLPALNTRTITSRQLSETLVVQNRRGDKLVPTRVAA